MPPFNLGDLVLEETSIKTYIREPVLSLQYLIQGNTKIFQGSIKHANSSH